MAPAMPLPFHQKLWTLSGQSQDTGLLQGDTQEGRGPRWARTLSGE